MDKPASSSLEASLLAAVAQTDPSAWCFLPVPPNDRVTCSEAFNNLWNIPDSTEPGSTAGSYSLTSVSCALTTQGIDANAFLTLVSSSDAGSTISVFLLRRDSLKLQAQITALVSSGKLVGHFVRFNPVVDAAAIDMLMQEITAAQRRLEVLSQRERQVLQMVYDGRTNKAISISTEISEKTVEKHRARIMQKLELNCAAQLYRLVSKAWLMSDILRPSGSPAKTDSSATSAHTRPLPPMVCE